MLRRDDGAVSEVVGFVLSFALSAIFLLISLSSFHAARDNTDAVLTAVELKTIANRIATHVVEAGLVGQEFENATMNITVSIPAALNGHPYVISANESEILVATSDGTASATASTLKLDAVTGFEVYGTVYSSDERVIITYSRQGTERHIHIHGD